MEINWQKKYQDELAHTRAMGQIISDLTKDLSSVLSGDHGWVIARVIPYSTTDYYNAVTGNWTTLSDATVYPEPFEGYLPEDGMWVKLP